MSGSPRARLMVVDDSRSVRGLLVQTLGEQGFDVVAYESGESALAALSHQTFDLVLLDVVMRGMDGLTVLARIRQRFDLIQLPVLMATARGDSDDIVRALELGANDYVTKPIDMRVAIARIDSLLRIHREVRERRRPVVLGRQGTVHAGTVLDGRYELQNELGRGGFAVVYRAKQLSTGQSVAVKLMHADRAAGGDVELARFRRESDLIGELRHPHVARLIDSGWLEVRRESAAAVAMEGTGTTQSPIPETVPDLRDTKQMRNEVTGSRSVAKTPEEARVPYIVMELLEGRSLAAMLGQRGRLSIGETVEIVLPVVSALWEAHRNGVVHRDLKPGNIFLAEAHDRVMRPMVLDFGVAKLLRDGDWELTQDGMVGTPGWWSPEQAMGEGRIDGRSDTYQLGAVIYQCVTGERPFDARGVRVVHEIAAGTFERPRNRVPNLPEAFEKLVLTMMATQPEDRFPTMRAVARALLPFAARRTFQRWEPIFEEGGTVPPPT